MRDVMSYEYGDGVVKCTNTSDGEVTCESRFYVGIYGCRYGPFDDQKVAEDVIKREMKGYGVRCSSS